MLVSVTFDFQGASQAVRLTCVFTSVCVCLLAVCSAAVCVWEQKVTSLDVTGGNMQTVEEEQGDRKHAVSRILTSAESLYGPQCAELSV